MFCASLIALLLAGLPSAALASAGAGAIDDTLALAHPTTGADSIGAHDCASSNVLRRLSGCSALIASGAVRGDALARAYRNRGTALFSLGEKRQAIEDFDSAIEIAGGTAELYLARGIARLHLGEHAGAIEDLLGAVALDPDNAAAYAGLGVAWETLGDDRRALDAYDRSLGLEPHNAMALNNRGNVLARMGLRRQALAAYDRALSLNPGYASAYYNRAAERCLDGQAEPAVADYLEAMRLGERHRAAVRDFLSRQGYFEPAASVTVAGGDLETALRLWSKAACTPAPTEAVRSGGDEGMTAAQPDGKAI